MNAEVVVVGAGVVGLTAGIGLAEAGANVRIIAERGPSETTSMLATAMVGPTFGMSGERGDRWAEVTHREVTGSSVPGVHVCRGRFVARPANFVPPGAEALPGFALCAPSELAAGYETGFWAEVPLVDMPRYLDHLADRFGAAGGEVEIKTINSLDQAAALAPVVVNCSGLGAAELAHDPMVTPLRGPKIVVENPGLDTFLIAGPPGPEGTSWHPHGDIVVLGGSAKDSSDVTPDPGEERAIIDRCAAIEPRLADARVLEHRVGLRPNRPAVRLEAEQRNGWLVVHNYGHAGLGVTLAWGCALEVVAMLDMGGTPTAAT